MAAEGRFFVAAKFKKSQNRNGFGSFLCGGGAEINKKSINKLER